MKLALAALLAMSACGPDRDIYVFVTATDLEVITSECDCERAYYELPVGTCWDYRDCPCMFGGGCQPGHTVSGTTLRISGCSSVVEVPLPTTFPTFTLSEDNGRDLVFATGSAETIWFQRSSIDEGATCRQSRTYTLPFEPADIVHIEGPTTDHVTDLGTVHVTPITIVEGTTP